MKTTAIRIEGQIISPEIFDRFESNDIKGQLSKDFGFERDLKVKEEIARAWADAKDQWSIFNRRIKNLGDKSTGTTETRKYWVIPFLDNLGFNSSVSKLEIVNEKSYAISHRADNHRSRLPLCLQRSPRQGQRYDPGDQSRQPVEPGRQCDRHESAEHRDHHGR